VVQRRPAACLTMTMPILSSSAKSNQRRQTVLEAAVSCFARKGLYGTTTHEIAERAGISQPYVYRLFPDKASLFASSVEFVSDLMATTLAEKLSEAAASVNTPENLRTAARSAYTDFVVESDVMRFLMQANCATEEPIVANAVRACYAKQVMVVSEHIRSDEAVRQWFGDGMLANVVASLGLADVNEPWARTLSGGLTRS
jgi:AcrR family transcriptional regulator